MCNAAVAFLTASVVIGMGATLVMDAWGLVQKHVFGVAPLSYALVGRWLGHLVRGRIRHDRIAASPPIRAEALIGWTAHYLTGIVFAAILLGSHGLDWAREPSPGPALAVGLATLAAPLLIMQPAMGAGLAARRMPHPWQARARSALTHAVFGAGLFATGWAARPALAPLFGTGC